MQSSLTNRIIPVRFILFPQVHFKALGRAFHFELERASPKLTSDSILLIRKDGYIFLSDSSPIIALSVLESVSQ